MRRKYRPIGLSILCFSLFIGSCAYFNTFYNAKKYFREAEKIRKEKEGESVPISAMDKYGKTMEKCEKVLSEFPESKFRIDAMLLMSKARYYRKEYDVALTDLGMVISTGKPDLAEEASYWRALCKWKKGSPKTAIDELTLLLERTHVRSIQANCHLSLSEIANELKNSEMSLMHLEEAAVLTRDRSQRSVIYNRIAEKAFKQKNYDMAKKAYEKVISNSLSKDKIEHAHLQVLTILRLMGEHRTASRKIKAMIRDDKFNKIAGDLELELVKLYRAQGEKEEIETRLESITNTYQRSKVSAQAYYMLGEIYTAEKWDLMKAKEYFEQVKKEFSKSIYSPFAKSKISAIDIYLQAEQDLETHLAAVKNVPDSGNVGNDSLKSIAIPERSMEELYYQLADVELFRFNRNEEGILYMEKIISDYPGSPFHPKAMFTLYFVYENNGDSLKAKHTKNELIKSHPNSEYTANLLPNVEVELNQQEIMYQKAESLISNNLEQAIESFKDVIKYDEATELASFAAYAIGYYYDESTKIDSAMKYYTWIQDNHPRSDQSDAVVNRLYTLNLVLNSLQIDTLSTSEIQEEN